MGEVGIFKIYCPELVCRVLSENGSISLDEYMRVLGTRGLKSESEMEEELEEALKVFDKEGDGYILASEFKEVRIFHAITTLQRCSHVHHTSGTSSVIFTRTHVS